MADQSRLDDLRRRVEKDPASIAFAQLAEEYRRAGNIEQAVEVCRAGLTIHPGYLSARVTLGRALVELNQLDEAQHELQQVLHSAPENLAAIRGLAEIHHRRGELSEALTQYRAALSLARNDPDLERTVEELSREVTPQRRAEPANGLTFEQMHQELMGHAPASAATAPTAATALQAASAAVAPIAATAGRAAPAVPVFDDVIARELAPVAPPPAAATPEPTSGATPALNDALTELAPVAAAGPSVSRAALSRGESEPAAPPDARFAAVVPEERVAPESLVGAVAAFSGAASFARNEAVEPAVVVAPVIASRYNAGSHATDDHAERTIAALSRWLDALNVSRTDSRA